MVRVLVDKFDVMVSSTYRYDLVMSSLLYFVSNLIELSGAR